MATMLSWRSEEGVGLEAARVLLGGGGFRAVGRMIRDVPGGVFTAAYRLVVGDDGAVQRLVVDAATAERERHLTISRSADGDWLVDDGSGTTRPSLGAALDVGVASSPLFTAMPIRRLGLHREPGRYTVPVAFVSLPEATVELVEQTYRTLSVGSGSTPSVIGFSVRGFSTEVTVDADGLVLDHPGVARRAELAPRR